VTGHGLDSVIPSPHAFDFIPSYGDKCSVLFAENLRRYLAAPESRRPRPPI